MEQTFCLETGKVLCRTVGERLEVWAEIVNDGRGLYKAWIKGDGGRMELGTLIPEQNCLCLRRMLLVEEVKKAGCWPLTDAGVLLAHRFGGERKAWCREEQPARLFPKDAVLQDAAAALKICLFHRAEDGFCLAVPFGRTIPFGLIPVFCFARIQWLEGKSYAVFRFDQDGTPRMPDV